MAETHKYHYDYYYNGMKKTTFMNQDNVVKSIQ